MYSGLSAILLRMKEFTEFMRSWLENIQCGISQPEKYMLSNASIRCKTRYCNMTKNRNSSLILIPECLPHKVKVVETSPEIS